MQPLVLTRADEVRDVFEGFQNAALVEGDFSNDDLAKMLLALGGQEMTEEAVAKTNAKLNTEYKKPLQNRLAFGLNGGPAGPTR